MLLTIDVGNTNISCGIYDNDLLIAKFRFITKQTRTTDELALQFHSIMEVKGIKESDVTDIVLSSVVPNLNNDLISAVNTLFGKDPFVIGPGIKTGIVVTIENPKSVGADLIVDAVAAYEMYKRDVLVVDFGTCTKFLYINEKGEFQYGVLSPGLEIYASSLWQQTAQLPQVQLKKPKTILARGTVDCMQAGIVYGYIGLTEGIITQLKKEIGHDFPVLGTGGLGRYICPETDMIDSYDPDIAYKGMKLIFEKNKK